MAARPEGAGRIAEPRAERDAKASRILDHDIAVGLLMDTYVRLKDSADAFLPREARLHLAEATRLTNEKRQLRDLERGELRCDFENL